MAPTTLTDLPPELLDHITTYLPIAQSISRIGQASESLQTFVERDAWQTFNFTRFPYLHPANTPSHTDTARSLTTLSKSWDRRAFIARYVEPSGEIYAYPGGRKVERRKWPKSQTIGFSPQLDVYETVGQRWQDSEETLAFSAGAEVCVRKKSRRDGRESVRWTTYRPLSAYEGRDDITTLHLLREDDQGYGDGRPQRLVSGTANGDLKILSLPGHEGGEVSTTYFATQGLPVRSSSLQQCAGQKLLAASLGDARVSIYEVDPSQTKIASSSSLEIRPPQAPSGARARHQRIWSTRFLSPQRLAVGIGPSEQPIQIYNLASSGIGQEPVRKFGLQNDDFTLSHLDVAHLLPSASPNPPGKKPSSSIYPIVPLSASSSSTGSSEGTVFLSGAYDGTIRLHDLRSHRDVEQSYTDPTDDSAIYSLLPRGHESIVAGTSRHSLLKVFDLRLGAKCYEYLDAAGSASRGAEPTKQKRDWNLFLKPHNAPSTSTTPGRRESYYSSSSRESSVYSLAAAAAASPYLYAGVEGAVVELAFTGVTDRHPDPRFRSMRAKEDVLDLAMYDQTAGGVKLYTQRSVSETWRLGGNPVRHTLEFPRVDAGLDERWRVGGGPR
ncbi:hypothetical protein LTR53_012484 [Teratosphaeriaceae sp. CCFEE 6253]|nr:hypothetical protein LTR53_012484 [Teratosphaeriaceae sp. CCFEE 6253]